jgi:hypothetical protein
MVYNNGMSRTDQVEPLEDRMRRGGSAALEEVGRFFMKEGSVFESLRRITGKLEELGIPYAVAGGMALVAHGYNRSTTDVDILVTREGCKAIHEHLEGLGYIAPFAGSKNLRDTATGTRIEFIITGDYPGDGKPKPVAFPHPDQVATEIDGVRYIGLVTLLEMKLASGMTNPRRGQDLVDVQNLIEHLALPRDLSGQLNDFVRAKFEEIWDLLHSPQE